ncbi:MAG: hypothetical protein NW205_01740 [Hyphomicrobiaceae bacterium]|nr:hypothetical protein [Hyphomicrobiaceae bacterium]
MRTFLAILVLSSGLLIGFDYVLKPWLVPSRPHLSAVSVPEPVQPVRGERVETSVSPIGAPVTPAGATSPVSAGPVATINRNTAGDQQSARTDSDGTVGTPPTGAAAMQQIGAAAPLVVPAAIAVGAAQSAVPMPSLTPPITTPVPATGLADPAAQAEAETRPRATQRRPARTQQSAADPARRKVQELFTNPLGRF